MGNTWNQRIIHPAGEKEPLPKLFCFRVFRVFRGLNSGFKVYLIADRSDKIGDHKEKAAN